MKISESFSRQIPFIASLFYIILFVYAASSKFFDFQNFQIQIGQSPILTAYAGFVSWSVPLIELLIVVLFLVPKFIPVAFFASYYLMIMFTTYIVIILNFSDFIPCSCGGVLEKLGWHEHIVFNGVFIVIALVGLNFYYRNINLKLNKI